MDDFKKDILRDHMGLAAIVIGGINSFGNEANPISKFKTCITLKKSALSSTFNNDFFISTSDMLNKTFDSAQQLRKFYAIIEEIYENDFVNFKSKDKGDIEGLSKLIEEFLVKQDEDDYVDPEISAEVERMVRDIENGVDDEDDEDFFDDEDENEYYDDDYDEFEDLEDVDDLYEVDVSDD